MAEQQMRSDEPRRDLSRRALLGAFGAGAATAAVVGAGGVALARSQSPSVDGDVRYDFFGEHQAGITTPMQNYLHFAAFDVTTQSRDQLVATLEAWTAAAAQMTMGQQVGTFGAVGGPYDAPPDDTGEALDLPASGLTITFGFGPTLFETADGVDRFGLAAMRPAGLVPLPHFPGDAIDERISGGDLCVQACANDAQVAVHAVRNLARIAFGTASVRWAQTGFGQSSLTSADMPTPRNLFGFKDGTANILGTDSASLDRSVWVPASEGPQWMNGGTYLALRKIRMTIETWDRTSLREQEAIFGRTKKEGAPLSGGEEFTAPDFARQGREGEPLIDPASHMALAHPSSNGGAQMLRRAYNFADGSDDLGRLDAGLFFLAFQRSIEKQFVPIQMNLSRNDLMNEYVRYVSSATFAVPPGVEGPDHFIAEGLFT